MKWRIMVALFKIFDQKSSFDDRLPSATEATHPGIPQGAADGRRESNRLQAAVHRQRDPPEGSPFMRQVMLRSHILAETVWEPKKKRHGWW